MVGGAGVASMFVNTREADVSPWLTTLSKPKSMNADFRVSETDVSSSVWMNPPVGGMSSTASGSSSTSWPASAIAVSKSGSSSSGGTSTTVFRFGGAGAAGGAAAGRFGTSGLRFGGSAAGGRGWDPGGAGIATRGAGRSLLAQRWHIAPAGVELHLPELGARRLEPLQHRSPGPVASRRFHLLRQAGRLDLERRVRVGGRGFQQTLRQRCDLRLRLGRAERRCDRLPLGAGRRVHIQEHEAGRLPLSRFRHIFARRRG